jgi:hypothetical protein
LLRRAGGKMLMTKLNERLKKRKPGNPWRHKNPHLSVQYFVNDGRDAAGIIELSGGYFRVYDPDGNILGKFRDLMVAARALPPARAAK